MSCSLYLACKSVCEVDKCLLSLGSVVLSIQDDSCVFAVFLIYYVACETLNCVECSTALADNSSCILAGDLYEYQLFACLDTEVEVDAHFVSDISEESLNRMSLNRVELLDLIQHRVFY